MVDLYSRIFNDIFHCCEPYVMHDFLNVRGNSDNKYKFCLFTCKKIFDETIKVLDKSKYNGEIVLQDNIVFDLNNIFSSNEIIKSSTAYLKKKIVLNNGIIKLANAREVEKRERIILIPIDGAFSFLCGNNNFSTVIILQEEVDGKFATKHISIFNPVRKDIRSFDVDDGCKYNEKKITNDAIYDSHENNVIFINDGSSQVNFDLTKLSQISTNLFFSKSIFSSLVDLMTTGTNMCVYKINKDNLEFVEFICKTVLFKTRKVGEHLIIEKR